MPRTFRPRLTVVAALLLFLPPLEAAEKSSAYQAALSSISASELGNEVGELADVALEGREAGTAGGHAAGEHLAEQYKRLRFAGAGPEGGYFQPFAPNFRNVLAVLPGSDPKLRDQVIVVGAHYDHLGYGGRSSLGPYGYVHPGADDNASGTSAVLEIAQAFSLLPSPPKRTVLFAHWDAEEKGLLGSKYWVANPTLPREHVAAMINLDMIGRLRENRLNVYGVGSGAGWRRLVSLANEEGLHLAFRYDVSNRADHHPFYATGIPVVMFHTGMHDQYHRPSDAAQLINKEGLEKVARLVFAVAYELADGTASPAFRTATPVDPESPLTGKPVDRLGVGWNDDAATAGGVRVTLVKHDTPAERAGVQTGDLIVRFAGRDIRCDADFFATVSSAESPATVTVVRSESPKPVDLKVELVGDPLRWGFTWRVDEAETGAIILTHVVPGSPADQAGLAIGDRVYRVAGRDFADETEFARLVKTSAESLQLLVERDGRVRHVPLRARLSETIRRAA